MRTATKDVVALGFARMADAVANSFMVVTLPLYIESLSRHGQPPPFGMTPSMVTGFILAAFGLASAFLQPLAGRMSDKAGNRKRFVIGGLIVMLVMNFLCSIVTGYWLLLLVRLGQGVSAAFTITASVALVNEVSERRDRGGNMGTYNSLRLIGFGTGPLVAGFVVSGGPYELLGFTVDGFDAAFYVATLGALVGAVLVWWLVTEPDHHGASPGEVAFAIRDRDGDNVLDPIFTLGLASFVMALCVALLASIEPQVNARLDQGARWFGIQFGVFILSVASTQPLVGRASDRWGRRPFVIAGLLLLAPTTLAQGLVTSPWAMVFARLAQGLAGSMVFAPALALAGDLTRKGESGAKLAVLTMSFGLGLSGGQLVSGFLTRFGYIVPFAVGASLALVMAAVVRSQVQEPD